MPEVIRKRVVNIDVSLIPYQQALSEVIVLAKAHTPSYACFSNVHMTIEAHESEEFRKYVNQADYAFADGMPLVFALKWLYGIRQERIAGMDFMYDVLKKCDYEKLSVFLFGSTSPVLDSLKQYITTTFPQVTVAGMISPPFRKLTEEENINHRQEINVSGAHIVLVGLGCPKQEIWMAQNSSQINACLLGVGGAFGLYADQTKRAPLWMRNIGLEWLFRLGQEPRRLFSRYAKTNSTFIYQLMKQKFNGN